MKKGDADSHQQVNDNSAINDSLYSQSYYSRGLKKPEDKKPDVNPAPESKFNMSGSSYSPPYSNSTKGIFPETSLNIQKTPKIEEPQVKVAAADTTDSQSAMKIVLMTLLLLSTAGNLLMLGIMQLLFSENGVLKLEWDGSFWYVYCLLSLPLFFVGFKQVNKMQ